MSLTRGGALASGSNAGVDATLGAPTSSLLRA